MTNKNLNLLLLFLLSFQLLQAQNNNNIKGVIYNSSDSTALAYVNVYIKDNPFGTISNEQGEFSFFFNAADALDTVVFSAIGYESQKYGIANLTNKELTIHMHPAIILLQEVVITPLDSKGIIKKALDKIEQNYPQKASILNAYTRQTIKENNKYTRFVEAALEIYNPTYFSDEKKSQKQNLIKLKKSEASLDNTHESLNYKLSTADFVNSIFINQTLSFLDDLTTYEFSFIEQVNYNEHLLYKIEFNTINDKDTSGYKGVIYIDKETYAFVSVQYQYKYNYTRQVKAYIKKFVQVNYKYLDYIFRIDFKKVSNKWYLSYIKKEHNLYIYTDDKSIIDIRMKAHNDLLINDIQVDNVSAFKNNGLINSKKDIYYQSGIYDDKIWESFNKIEPPKSLIK